MHSISIYIFGAILASRCVSRACDLADGFSERAAELVQRIRMSDEQLGAIPLVVQHVEMALNSRWPGSQVSTFGSTLTGLALRQSDIDCFGQLPNQTALTVKSDQVQRVLAQYPRLFTDFRSTVVNAIPIIKFKHIPSGFFVDLNLKTNEGIKNSQLVRYLIHADECVFHLAVIIKYWAQLHSVPGSKRLSGYGIVLLVIFYLQQKHVLPPVSVLQQNAKPYVLDNWNMAIDEIAYEVRNEEHLYELLGGFFEYYDSFDFDGDIISTYVARPVKRELFKNLHTVPSEFSLYRFNIGLNITEPLDVNRSVCIQDPLCHNKNVGKRLDTSSSSRLRTQLNRAVLFYRQNNRTVFLDQILSADLLHTDLPK